MRAPKDAPPGQGATFASAIHRDTWDKQRWGRQCSVELGGLDSVAARGVAFDSGIFCSGGFE
ncbi:Protein kinase domain-containing protein [Psidium guajava]|nr:Protein kinase domain-containing protein [Psidium guajava]